MPNFTLAVWRHHGATRRLSARQGFLVRVTCLATERRTPPHLFGSRAAATSPTSRRQRPAHRHDSTIRLGDRAYVPAQDSLLPIHKKLTKLHSRMYRERINQLHNFIVITSSHLTTRDIGRRQKCSTVPETYVEPSRKSSSFKSVSSSSDPSRKLPQ